MNRMIPLLERNEQFARTYTPAAALEASAVTDPHTTVKADIERLLASPSLPPQVSVSGHVYDIATGRLTTTHDARYPEWPPPASSPRLRSDIPHQMPRGTGGRATASG